MKIYFEIKYLFFSIPCYPNLKYIKIDDIFFKKNQLFLVLVINKIKTITYNMKVFNFLF